LAIWRRQDKPVATQGGHCRRGSRKFYGILAGIEENVIELDSMHRTAACEREKALQKAAKHLPATRREA